MSNTWREEPRRRPVTFSGHICYWQHVKGQTAMQLREGMEHDSISLASVFFSADSTVQVTIRNDERAAKSFEGDSAVFLATAYVEQYYAKVFRIKAEKDKADSKQAEKLDEFIMGGRR